MGAWKKRTYKELTIEELTKLFYATAIIGAESGYCTEYEAKKACGIFEIYAHNLNDPSVIELGLIAVGDADFGKTMN